MNSNAIKKKKDVDEEQRLQEALNEFRETFEDGATRIAPKAFIRGEIVNANKSTAVTPAIYKPSQNVKTKFNAVSSVVPDVEHAKKIAEEAVKKIMQQASKNKIVAAKMTKPETKKSESSSRMSNLESFKEELKQVQALRQERKGLRQQLQEKLGPNSDAIDRIIPSLESTYSGGFGSEFDDDPTTTNLYISNLPLDIQLEDLYETFGTFGPLASAKILYPRNDDERRRDHLCGFIAYMSRNDAARAWCSMSGERIRDSEIKVSWARPVSIPPIPFYVPISLRELAMPDPPSGLPFNAKPLSEDLRNFLRKYQTLPRLNVPLPTDNPELIDDYRKMISRSIIRVVIPTEKPLLALIHRVVEFLIRQGPLFEAILMSNERQNPMYRFLFENHHPTHVYYRWKLYSVLQGEDRTKWRLERFKMFENGSWWEPPPHSLFEDGMPPQLYSTTYKPKRKAVVEERLARKRYRAVVSSHDENFSDDEETTVGRRSNKKWRGVLSDDERIQLEDLLRNLLPDKNSIGDAMMWCVEHAECAKEIVQCIYESLCIKMTPLHKKIARIYLCSDILANCGARLRDVFYFRQYFGDTLLKIFVELNNTLEGIQSRIKAEQFRQRVMLCFRVWEDSSIYPTDVLINLQNIFLGLSKTTSEKEDGEDLDGEPLPDEDIDGVPLADDDIDGVPLDDSVVLTSLRSGRSGQIAATDNRQFTKSSWSEVEPGVSSKWDSLETIAIDEDESVQGRSEHISNNDVRRPDITIRNTASAMSTANVFGNDDDGVGKSSRNSTMIGESGSRRGGDDEMSLSKEHDEERRKMLRDIEVKIVKLQDELESEQCRNINDELAKYRVKLIEKMEEKLSKMAVKRMKREEKTPRGERHERDRRDDRERKRDRSERGNRDRSRGKDRSWERERDRDYYHRERDRRRASYKDASPDDEQRSSRDRHRDRRIKN